MMLWAKASLVSAVASALIVSGLMYRHYDSKIETINLNHALEYERNVNEALQKSIALAKSQNETIDKLNQDKNALVRKTGEKNAKLEKDVSNIARVINNGGLLYDPHARSSSRGSAAGKTTGTPGNACPDTGGILSRQTTDNLIAYARSAEQTRLDLIRQKGYADLCVQAYNELVGKYNEVLGSNK